jgi:hypothetical protein
LAGFLFRLETEDGAPVEPPTLSSAVPDCREGDTIHLGKRTLRVIGKRDEDADRGQGRSLPNERRKCLASIHDVSTPP